jgi:hypothetical protein
LIGSDDIRDFTKPVLKSDAERNAIANKFPQDKLGPDALEYQADVINDELRKSLSNSITLDDKAALVLDAERKKDKLGLNRFYNKAIQSIGDYKNTLPDTDAQMKKSLSQLQKELKKEKQLCCNDCD